MFLKAFPQCKWRENERSVRLFFMHTRLSIISMWLVVVQMKTKEDERTKLELTIEQTKVASSQVLPLSLQFYLLTRVMIMKEMWREKSRAERRELSLNRKKQKQQVRFLSRLFFLQSNKKKEKRTGSSDYCVSTRKIKGILLSPFSDWSILSVSSTFLFLLFIMCVDNYRQEIHSIEFTD